MFRGLLEQFGSLDRSRGKVIRWGVAVERNVVISALSDHQADTMFRLPSFKDPIPFFGIRDDSLGSTLIYPDYPKMARCTR
jgi:hypothetical protein